MSKDLTTPDPRDFGLASFADLLSSRTPIPGEEPGGFQAFRGGLLASLTPITPYECVVAESLIAIEWELHQRRRLREHALRKNLSEAVTQAAMRRVEAIHDDAVEDALDAAWEAHVEAGGDEDDWEDPYPFDRQAASERVAALVEGIISHDTAEQAAAERALTDLGVPLLDLMGEAYAEPHGQATRHDAKAQELERRRREVMRDYAALQRARPIDHAQTDDDIEDAEIVQS
ncbi:hypothetical protein LSUCC0031_00195 [Rhodobacterales bacterium LSUCC0031]|nr:hypothetical protein [Rhodobacterales bacterium LSUCC0031]